MIRKLLIVFCLFCSLLFTGCGIQDEESTIHNFKYIVIDNHPFNTADIDTITYRTHRGCIIKMRNGVTMYASTYILINDVLELTDTNKNENKVVIEIPSNFEGGFLKTTEGRIAYVSWKSEEG